MIEVREGVRWSNAPCSIDARSRVTIYARYSPKGNLGLVEIAKALRDIPGVEARVKDVENGDDPRLKYPKGFKGLSIEMVYEIEARAEVLAIAPVIDTYAEIIWECENV